ncbi:MAG: hypothetical protein KDA61_01320 [Planctomycetales bacterium]|nr:hypothetical protein [Planctomycetales bacterium]
MPLRGGIMLVVRHSLALLALSSALATTAIADASPIGFASLNGGTVGGGNGPTVTATTASQFRNYAKQPGPLNILVDRSLNIGGTSIASDKTILGVGDAGELVGSLQLSGVNNVIIQNLAISNPSNAGEGDSITLRASTNVWIDHNNIFNAPDGLLDIVRESDFVTVSWNKFFYTQEYADSANSGHRFAMLIGNTDNAPEDADNLRVTMHHNYWGDLVHERMPRVRYGDVHVFNNYFNTPGDNYAIRIAKASELLIENNSFEDVTDPYEKYITEGPDGLAEARGNLFVRTSGKRDAGDDVFDPPYEYAMDAAVDVKALVLASAGIGHLPSYLAGDFNQDGVVDGADLLAWQRGESSIPYSAVDLTEWQSQLGATNSQASTSPVPEPCGMALALAAIFAISSSGLRPE